MRPFLYLLFSSFLISGLASADVEPFYHSTCKINPYLSSLSSLLDPDGKYIISPELEKMFIDKGYHPVTTLPSSEAKVMSFSVSVQENDIWIDDVPPAGHFEPLSITIMATIVDSGGSCYSEKNYPYDYKGTLFVPNLDKFDWYFANEPGCINGILLSHLENDLPKCVIK
ncbi:MAG: hypothetical protein WCQ53_02370 [bacterium]